MNKVYCDRCKKDMEYLKCYELVNLQINDLKEKDLAIAQHIIQRQQEKIEELEQKETILDKVIDKLKEDAEIFKKENVDGALQNYVAKILKIIEGEKK